MLKQLQKTKDQKGFTIIEVLIVLAIAGLILLIVFLAVPALQRNSRNTAIKADVQNLLGGVGEYRAANSGANPAAIGALSGVVSYTGGNTTTMKIQGATTVSTISADPTAATVTPGTIQVYLARKCPDTGATPTSASPRSVAAFYVIETSSTPILQCSDT